ncbi:MAG TPA: tetratricopeptide repeat protein [Pyrinomonadaceae bacterium]|jgi:hypothetical protein
MANQKDGQFRERFTEMGAGLARQERPARPEMPTIAIDTNFDLTELESFAAGPAGAAGAVESLGAPTETGVGELDANQLDEALQKIQQQQLSEQISGLVEEALRLINAESYREAIYVLDEALAIVPNSASILYLKAYSLLSLGAAEEAYELLTTASELAPDGESLLTVLTLQGACVRAILDDVEAQLEKLRERGQLEAALRLVEAHLRRLSHSPTLLSHRCAILLALGRLAQAKQAALDGVERGGEENQDFFRRMYDQAVERETQPLLEPARLALRQLDAARAVKLLQACRERLSGQERYEAARAYAHEQSPQRSVGGLRALFSRPKEAAPEPLTAERRQRLLQWLLVEELDGGYTAMEQEDYARAANMFRHAEGVDAGCNIINYLHALAIFRHFQVRLEDQEAALDLAEALNDMKRAQAYVARAVGDPLIADRARALAAAVKNYQEQLLEIERERKRREEAERPVNELLNDYNQTMERLEKNRIGSAKELNDARARFRQLKERAQQVRRGRKPAEGAAVLGQLIEVLDKNLGQLDRMESDVRTQETISECITGFTQMMDYYKRYPISSESDMQRARARVTGLLEKVAQARKLLGYSGESPLSSRPARVARYSSLDKSKLPRRTKPAQVDQETWDVLDRVEEALLNVQEQLNPYGGGGGYGTGRRY